jgi:hypothetical protein
MTQDKSEQTFEEILNANPDQALKAYEKIKKESAIKEFEMRIRAIQKQWDRFDDICIGLKLRYFNLKEDGVTRATHEVATYSIEDCKNAQTMISDFLQYLIKERFYFGYEEFETMFKLFSPFVKGLDLLIIGYKQLKEKFEREQERLQSNFMIPQGQVGSKVA